MSLAVEKKLQAKSIDYRMVKLSEKAFTVDDVVKYSNGGVNPGEICKTMILVGKKTGKRYAVLLRGSDRLDFLKIKRLLGEEVAIGSPADVQEVAGVDPGAVCPFLLSVPLYVDEGVLELPRINLGSGDHLYGVEVSSRDLEKVVPFTRVDITK